MASPPRSGVPQPLMPPARSVVERKVVTVARAAPARARPGAPGAPSAATASYQVVRTTEVDSYDRPVSRAAVPAIGAAAAAAPPSDNFTGTARRAAKLSIPNALIEVFADIKDLIATLPSKTTMKNIRPKIKLDAASDRVTQEKRNIRVRGFIYAASREDDNDYHLIVGRDPALLPRMFMTMEISGLPPAGSSSLTRLKKARQAYKTFFLQFDLPPLSYDFYPNPFPIEVEGSLFFDMSHSGAGNEPGPQTLRPHMPTVFELHPIFKIKFNP